MKIEKAKRAAEDLVAGVITQGHEWGATPLRHRSGFQGPSSDPLEPALRGAFGPYASDLQQEIMGHVEVTVDGIRIPSLSLRGERMVVTGVLRNSIHPEDHIDRGHTVAWEWESNEIFLPERDFIDASETRVNSKVTLQVGPEGVIRHNAVFPYWEAVA